MKRSGASGKQAEGSWGTTERGRQSALEEHGLATLGILFQATDLLFTVANYDGEFYLRKTLASSQESKQIAKRLE